MVGYITYIINYNACTLHICSYYMNGKTKQEELFEIFYYFFFVRFYLKRIFYIQREKE